MANVLIDEYGASDLGSAVLLIIDRKVSVFQQKAVHLHRNIKTPLTDNEKDICAMPMGFPWSIGSDRCSGFLGHCERMDWLYATHRRTPKPYQSLCHTDI